MRRILCCSSACTWRRPACWWPPSPTPSPCAVVAYARRVNPTLDIVVRTHSQTEHEFLANYGVTESVLGELELAREMTRYALRHLDGDASEAPEVGGGRQDLGMGRGEMRP
jgi:hypothetical protein